MHGTLGVVFTRAGRAVRAKSHLEVVAGITQHLTAMLLDDGGDGGEGGEGGQSAVHNHLHRFGVEVRLSKGASAASGGVAQRDTLATGGAARG